jgi:hypothetical protein
MDGAMISVSPVSRRWWLAIPEEERERIEAAVPSGHCLVIKPGYRAKPGTTDVSLRDEGNHAVKEYRGTNIAWMCWAVLPRFVVTTDAEGYVRSIEEAS